MKSMQKYLSPKSSSGSYVYSLGIHALVYGSLILLLSVNMKAAPPPDEYLDLGYQTFDAPPEPVQEEKKVVRSPEPQTPVDTKAIPDNVPREIQDEKGVVAGTQEATKENNVGSESNGVAASTPYYKIKPKYPKAALVSGTEGWVLMQIDITEAGEVENIRIVDGEQRNLFQSEARRAVAQWKYRPFMDGTGKPHRKADHQVRVDFKLEEAETGGS